MNTLTFVFEQLLTLEMLAAGRRQTVRQHLLKRLYNGLHTTDLQHRYGATERWKGGFMDNGILVILFLIVSLIANFAMPSQTEK